MEVEYGIGQSLTVTNVGTGAEFTTDTDPVVTETTFHADGSRSVVAAGSNLIVLFPTDVPGGPIADAPSMTLVEGVAVYTISTGGSVDDPAGVRQHHGRLGRDRVNRPALAWAT